MEIKEIETLRKKYNGIQLWANEIALIAKTIEENENCDYLVFGIGNDSPMWQELNSRGRTTFIEDNSEWFHKITKTFPEIEAYLIQYPNNITQWKEIIDKPEKLELSLPASITSTKWDVILVDAPAGWQMIPEFAGRMSSIYMASKLIRKGGIVFVHDCDREVEIAFTNKYLKAENLLHTISGYSVLNMYKI